jgi:hypothetical protein
MKPKASVVAQKLLNLYRQAHVIIGGWSVLNPIFVDEATPDVIDALDDLPTGRFLAQHIANLKSGKTPMDSIERELLPYGGMMAESATTVQIKTSDWNDLISAINAFTPDQDGLDKIINLDIVKSFGAEWLNTIRAALAAKHPELLQQWAIINQTYNAYNRWNLANELLNQPINERARAQIQADMFEYETYLPMFGDAGMELLGKLRNFISSVKHTDEPK